MPTVEIRQQLLLITSAIIRIGNVSSLVERLCVVRYNIHEVASSTLQIRIGLPEKEGMAVCVVLTGFAYLPLQRGSQTRHWNGWVFGSGGRGAGGVKSCRPHRTDTHL